MRDFSVAKNLIMNFSDAKNLLAKNIANFRDLENTNGNDILLRNFAQKFFAQSLFEQNILLNFYSNIYGIFIKTFKI